MKKFMPFLLLVLVVTVLAPSAIFAAEPTNSAYPRGINQSSAIGRESAGWFKTGTGSIGYLTWSSVDATSVYGGKDGFAAVNPHVQEVNIGQTGIGLAIDPTIAALQAMGPHGNYSTSTVKCATCHSVHMAPVDSFILTQSTTGGANAAEVCALCHNATSGLSTKRVSVGPSGVVSNHGATSCSTTTDGAGCHGGVHGVGVSTYPTLAQNILNAGADQFIDYAISQEATTGLTADYFEVAANGVAEIDKASFAVSYLCTQCHQGSAFATVDGKSMYAADQGNQKSLSGYAPISGFLSSHPMLSTNATATPDWAETGATFSGQIAYADSVGCVSCHSKTDPNTNAPMFPHSTNSFAEYGNVDQGATDPVYGLNTDDPKGIWLEKASFAGADDTVDVFRASPEYGGGGFGRWGGSVDGVCFKCHRAGSGATATSGVGINY